MLKRVLYWTPFYLTFPETSCKEESVCTARYERWSTAIPKLSFLKRFSSSSDSMSSNWVTSLTNSYLAWFGDKTHIRRSDSAAQENAYSVRRHFIKLSTHLGKQVLQGCEFKQRCTHRIPLRFESIAAHRRLLVAESVPVPKVKPWHEETTHFTWLYSLLRNTALHNKQLTSYSNEAQLCDSPVDGKHGSDCTNSVFVGYTTQTAHGIWVLSLWERH